MLLNQLMFSPLIACHQQIQGSFYFVLLNIIFLELLEQYIIPEFQEIFRKMVILNLSQQINFHLIIYRSCLFLLKTLKDALVPQVV